MMHKLGRLPRQHNPRVPHMSALCAGRRLASPPAEQRWDAALPDDMGMMLNDQLGDCTCAAYYHGRQVWSANAAGTIDTASDGDVLKLYENACGYSPGDSNTDRGGVEQMVLQYLATQGATDGAVMDRLLGYVEVDPRVHDDVKRGIVECGFVYIGFQVPQYMMPPDHAPEALWDVEPGADATIIGGHAVICCGYDASGLMLISWGRRYAMTWAFWDAYVDEAYVLADAEWINAKGTTPGGLTMAQLQVQMSALRGGG